MGAFRAPDRVIADVARRQHGVVTRSQLNSAGVTRRMVDTRVRSGRLHRIHHGVYAAGHRALSNEGRWMGAVLACGEGAVLSHRSAAELWELLPPRATVVDVTVPLRRGRKRRRGVRIHRPSSLPRSATTHRETIPVTTPARTIIDLRRVAGAAEVRRAIRQANYLGLPLKEIATDGTRSDPEAAVLDLCRRNRLPAPEVNVKVGPYTADFLWREQRLVVEVDGWRAHRGRQAFLDDRARDAYLRLRGLEVQRFSDVQVEHDEPTVVALLRRYLDNGARDHRR
jgi:very-short-patch-repair endonuclease